MPRGFERCLTRVMSRAFNTDLALALNAAVTVVASRRTAMPVMMTAEVAGQTAEGYDQVLQHVGDAVRRAPGFLLHTSHAVEGGWRVIEVWDSKAAADAFYVEHIVPMLPPGIRP